MLVVCYGTFEIIQSKSFSFLTLNKLKIINFASIAFQCNCMSDAEDFIDALFWKSGTQFNR